MYKISQYFRDLIDRAGGPDKFAEKHELNPEAIRGYYNGIRDIQVTTAMGLSIHLELWKELVE